MTLSYDVQNEPTDDIIESLLAAVGSGGAPANHDLLRELVITALKMAEDGASRADLKIANVALKEMRYAFKVFAPYRGVPKLTVFGSARTRPDTPEYGQARELAAAMARRGYMVITGAGPGIMQAAQEGAGAERSFGAMIRLPFEQSANEVILHDAKLINFKYYFTRKLFLLRESDATALCPGGFGTHDEGFEILTLLQTGKSHLLPVVYLDAPGGDYWRNWEEYIRRHLLGTGYVSEEDFRLFKVTDRVEEAVEEIDRFYRVYHSMRYVREKAVMRLKRPLSEEALERIRREFAPILADGTFVAGGPLPEEANEPETAHLARLVFHFDRHQFGRLRALIDAVNAA